jgi:hypothetical protein
MWTSARPYCHIVLSKHRLIGFSRFDQGNYRRFPQCYGFFQNSTFSFRLHP